MEEKEKFFAQYWGQRVINWKGNKVMKQIVSLAYLNGTGYHLELTPLSSITDEDAIEVVKILGWQLDGDNLLSISRHHAIRQILIGTSPFGVNPSIQKQWQVYHYLLSKCYALPWREYSVEQLVEMGWVKLT